MGIGRAADADGRRAGAAAVEQAVRGDEPKLAIVFCSDGHDAEGVALGVHDQLGGGVPVVGCSSVDDAGVVVTVLGGPGYTAATGVGENAARHLREASARAAFCAEAVEGRRHRLLLLFAEGLSVDQQDIVRGAYSVVGGDVPVVGGGAPTFQIHGRRVLRGAVVAAAVGSDAPFGIGVGHGWAPVGEPVVVSSSDGNRVFRLDDEPALDVYLRSLGAPPEAATDRAAFSRFALLHPLSLGRRSGHELRFVADVDFEDRSLACIAEVPEGGVAWLMTGDHQSVLDATDAACIEALKDFGGGDPAALVAFDGIARRAVLGEPGVAAEAERLAEHAAGGPVATMSSYGEIARTQGLSGYHNQTLVVLALP